MGSKSIIIAKTWRSELSLLLGFVVFSIIGVFLSRVFPWSIIHGELFTIGNSVINLRLPLFWFLPAGALGMAIYRIYNVRYTLDKRGIHYQEGILSFSIIGRSIRFEDIRSIEINQSFVGRILDVGDLALGTAATGRVEVTFRGIGSPTEVKRMIQAESDRRQQNMQKQYEEYQQTANS